MLGSSRGLESESTKRGEVHHIATGHGPMVQGGLLTTHPGGVHGEGLQGIQAPWRGLGWGRAREPSGVPVVAPLSSFGDSGGFQDADFLYIFSGIFGALLMAGKPEIQKQQKTGTGNSVHCVNRLVQICSKVYESSSKEWQSHTKHAWSKQKLYIRLGRINIRKLNSCSSSSR